MKLLNEKALKGKYKATIEAAEKADEGLKAIGLRLWPIEGGNKGQFCARCYQESPARGREWTANRLKAAAVPYKGNNLFDPKKPTNSDSESAE